MVREEQPVSDAQLEAGKGERAGEEDDPRGPLEGSEDE